MKRGKRQQKVALNKKKEGPECTIISNNGCRLHLKGIFFFCAADFQRIGGDFQVLFKVGPLLRRNLACG